MSAPTTPAAQVQVLGDAIMDTFVALCEYLGIDPMEAAKLPGKPSEVFISAIEARAAAPTPPAAGVPDDLREAVADAVAEALGEALDCTRVWSAWGYGTMSEDDFRQVADDPARVAEITDAAIAAMASATPPASEQQRAVVMPDEVLEKARSLLSQAKNEILHMAECAENLGEDLEDEDGLSEEVSEARALAEGIDEFLRLNPHLANGEGV